LAPAEKFFKGAMQYMKRNLDVPLTKLVSDQKDLTSVRKRYLESFDLLLCHLTALLWASDLISQLVQNHVERSLFVQWPVKVQLP